MEWFEAFIVVFGSGIRFAIPLILACLAGLWSERSGVVDIGLEGKILVGAFASAAAATFTGSVWLGLAAGIAATIAVSLVHGYASIDQRANQIVSGTAINMVADGLTALIGNAIWSQGGRTPQLPESAQFREIALPFAKHIGAVPILGPIYQELISDHDLISYVAFLMVPLTYWALYRTRFGLRLRAVGENPAAVDTAGISVRGLRYSAVVICGVLVGLAGIYLALSQTGYFQPHMSAGRGFIALAALVFAKWRPWPALATCLLFGFLDAARDPSAGRRASGHRPGPGAGDRGASLRADGRAARGLHRQGDSAASVGDSLCQGTLTRWPSCSPPQGPPRRTHMRPTRASRSGPRSARPQARSIRAGTLRTRPIPRASAPRPAPSPPWRRPASVASSKSASSATARALCTPCGGCRQRIREFADDATLVHVAGPEGVRATFRLSSLLPESFGPGHLRS